MRKVTINEDGRLYIIYNGNVIYDSETEEPKFKKEIEDYGLLVLKRLDERFNNA